MVHFMTAANVFLPIGPGEINGAKWTQKARGLLAALGREALINASDVLV